VPREGHPTPYLPSGWDTAHRTTPCTITRGAGISEGGPVERRITAHIRAPGSTHRINRASRPPALQCSSAVALSHPRSRPHIIVRPVRTPTPKAKGACRPPPEHRGGVRASRRGGPDRVAPADLSRYASKYYKDASLRSEDTRMSQLYVPVILRNAREYVLARHGHLAADQVHTYESQHVRASMP
jgi:hypothetical protein